MADNIDNLIEETVQFCIDYDKRGMTERVYRRVISSAIKKACEIGLPVESNKPKSKIEEAIERELQDYCGPTLPLMRRIVNLTLDEAKKAAVGRNGELDDTSTCLVPVYVCERIEALKVKE